MSLIQLHSPHHRTIGAYGDAGSSRALYNQLRELDRSGIMRTYGDSPPGLAAAMRYAVTLEVTRPFGAGDLSTAARFITSAASADDQRVRSFLDVVMPPGDPSRARLPLLVHRGDFSNVLRNLVRLDQGHRGRVLLMRAFVVLATDFGLMPPSRS